LEEKPVTDIPIDFPVEVRDISSMAWLDDDTLVLIPQRPAEWGEGDGIFFTLQRADIEAYLAGENQQPLRAGTMRVVAPNIARFTAGYSGFEALTFVDGEAFGTIEAVSDDRTAALVVSGEVSPDGQEVVFGITTLTLVISEVQESGYSHETVVTSGDVAYVIHELNSSTLTGQPQARMFTRADRMNEAVTFPHIEYRVTDATGIDQETGIFWVLNTYSPQQDDIQLDGDPFFEAYGTGATHAEQAHVERLLPLRVTESGVERAEGVTPILLSLSERLRPWEGVTRFDEQGFLLVTSGEPLLAFVTGD
jgi:hypothetical protein